MKYHLKSFFVLFLIIAISFIAVFYFYFGDLNFFKENADIFWEEASIKITTNWGLCSPVFPCFETYKLSSIIGSDGKIFHNDELVGGLSEKEAKKFIKTSFDLYQNNICTPFYATDISENYELKIDEKVYKFGNNKGCQEMQAMINAFKKPIGI